jgi:hypothetical protein
MNDLDGKLKLSFSKAFVKPMLIFGETRVSNVK